MRNTPDKVETELAAREAALQMPAEDLLPREPPLDLSHLMEHPQVQAAISAAVAEAAKAMLAQLSAERGAAPSVGSDQAFAESLALKIGELIDQGRPNQRRAVAPAVLLQRQEAREAMTAAILRHRAAGVLPEYETRALCYLSEELVHPTWIGTDRKERATRFCWPGVPNEAMVPVNEAAREIHRHFLDSIGHIPLPAASDPLVAGFRVINRSGDPVPELGAGHSDGALRVIGREPVHILGTVADPARPPQQ